MIPLHYKLFEGDIPVNTSVVPVSFVLSTKAIDDDSMCSMIRMSIVLLQRALGKDGMS